MAPSTRLKILLNRLATGRPRTNQPFEGQKEYYFVLKNHKETDESLIIESQLFRQLACIKKKRVQKFFLFKLRFICNFNPASNYMFKVNNRNTRTRCEICSKLTIKTPERRHWGRSGVFIVNFEHILHLALEFLL